MRRFLTLLSGGLLDRVLRTVDAKIAAETDRTKIKGDIIIEHYRSRADWMRAGGFWLMMLYAVPLSVWWSMVIYDSAFGCADCIWPNDWTVAALPAPLDDWAGGIIISIFGVIGVSRFRK